jgi:inner membrane protein
MDPLTHTTLGAALGHTLLGKQLGRKAILYGAIAGNIPDLDALAYPWLNALERLEWHRGISHSIPILAILSIPLALLIKTIHRTHSSISLPHTIFTLFIILVTHALIDACTVYGTQLFAPFTDTRYAWNLIFFVDPFFTLPLFIACALITLFRKFRSPHISRNAILISSAYILLLAWIKPHIDTRFTQARQNQNLTVISSSLSAPAFPGPFLWREISRSSEGCYIAYTSLLDLPHHRITHALVAYPFALQQRWQEHPTIRRLQWFSEGHGYFSEDSEGRLIYHDMRFGETRIDPYAPLTPENTYTLFRWKLIPQTNGDFLIVAGRHGIYPSTMLHILWKRLLGHPVL